MTLTVGSLFSGVGGLDLGLERAGMAVAWQCEIDPACRKVLAHRWPETHCYDDVRKVDAHNASTVDVLCGGFPCQDVSLAGPRLGLAGERSGLWWEFARVAAEIAPRWVVIENVPGLLSSRAGRDMAAVLAGLEKRGYGWAYRVLDARYWGVAQRRRRVFIVGHPSAERAAQVLFERESVPRNSAASPQARQTTTGDAGPGATGGRGTRDVAYALNASERWDGESETFIPVGFNARQDPDHWADSSGPLDTDGCSQAIASPSGVRRLTPTECERLQGFPDGWTDVGASDTVRYRQLGNAVCVPVAEWIGRRILAVTPN